MKGGLFKARKKRKCDTAELQSQWVIGPKMLKGQHVDVDLLSITVFTRSYLVALRRIELRFTG